MKNKHTLKFSKTPPRGRKSFYTCVKCDMTVYEKNIAEAYIAADREECKSKEAKNGSPLLTQVLESFRKKFPIAKQSVDLLDGLLEPDVANELESFLSQVIEKVERETREKVTEELTSNALMKHNPDFQGRALPKK